jgi:hypothetical protein
MISSKNLRNTILFGLLVLALLLSLHLSPLIRASSSTILISEVEYDSIQSGTDSAYGVHGGQKKPRFSYPGPFSYDSSIHCLLSSIQALIP